MNKVLLINPPETMQTGFTCPPLGLLCLAGTLRDNGFDIRIIDGCIQGWSNVEEEMRKFFPDIVGITCLTPGRKNALNVARMAKTINQNCVVVLGGAHPTIMYRQLLGHYKDVDIVVRGEGEITFLEIVREVDLEKIDGIVYRDGDRIIKNSDRKYVKNLDELSFPAWDMIADTLWKYPSTTSGLKNYRGIDLYVGPRVSVTYSRGCTGRCDFCSTWWIWKGWRHRSAKNMVDELEWLYESFRIRHFCFADDALTVDKQATIDLCDEIVNRHLNIAFLATTRTDCVDMQILEKLKQAGCYEITYGIETASPRLLSRMKKDNDVQTSEIAITSTKQTGLRAGCLLIVGNVGETEETIDETIDFLRKTNPDSIGTVGGLWILPGTGLYQYAKKIGIIDDDFWLSDEPYMIYTHEHSLRKLRFFTHALRRQKKISEMSIKYRIIYILHSYILKLKEKLLSALDKYPAIKSVLKRCYFAVSYRFFKVTRFENKS